MMPQAQVRGCPELSGLGRLRQRAAVMARARSRYSSFRWSRLKGSVSAVMASYVACMALGTEVERADFTGRVSHQNRPRDQYSASGAPARVGTPASVDMNARGSRHVSAVALAACGHHHG